MQSPILIRPGKCRAVTIPSIFAWYRAGEAPVRSTGQTLARLRAASVLVGFEADTIVGAMMELVKEVLG